MSQPTPYTPNADFSQQEANNASGRSTVNTAALDAEFAAIETTLDQTLANIQLLQRDDGQLKDTIVSVMALDQSVINLMGGWTLKGAWLTVTNYAVNDIVSSGEYTYVCLTAHQSGIEFDSQYWSRFGFAGSADAAIAAGQASASAASAATSATTATTKAASATASATAAATSSGNAADYAATATTKAGEAAASAVNAANSAAKLPNLTAAGANKVVISNDLGSAWEYKTYQDLVDEVDISARGAEQIGYLPAGTDAFTTDVQSKLRERVSVKDFGAIGDGTTDDTTAVQAALNSGAVKVIGITGDIYRISTQLLINRNNIEIDFQHAQLLLDDATGLKNHIKIGDGISQKTGIRLNRIAFARQQAATAGYAIDADFIGVVDITGCRIYGNNEIYNGIKISRGIIINIEDNYIDNCLNLGIYLYGTDATTNRTIDVSIRENRIEGGTSALSTWDFVEGVFCHDNIFFNTSSAAVTCSASSNVNGLSSFKFKDNDFDTAAAGLFINNISNIQLNNNWFSAITGIGADFGANVVATVISGNQMYPTSHGIRYAGLDARINANIISGGDACIYLRSTASRCSVVGNTLQGAAYGVNMAEGATNCHIAGNHIYSMSSGTISGEVAGAGNTVQSNKGDSIVGAPSFIIVGASPFTYTAGVRTEYVSVFSGTVSNLQLGASSFGFGTNRSIVLAPGQSVTVTYSAAPTMLKNSL